MVQQMISEIRTPEMAEARDFCGSRAYGSPTDLENVGEERRMLFRVLWVIEQANFLYDGLVDDVARRDLRRGMGAWVSWCAEHLPDIAESIDKNLDAERELNIARELAGKLSPT